MELEVVRPTVTIRRLEIPDVLLIDLDMQHDDRGFFVEAWRDSWFADLSPGATLNTIPNALPLQELERFISSHRFVQVNHSFSFPGVQRGLHYQLNPKAMGKLVHVVLGEIYDVAVDIRKGSPWYGQHVGVLLDSGQSLYVPPGFAHGFYARTSSHVIYQCTEEYDPSLDRAIYWDRNRWPIPGRAARDIITSEKDRNAPRLEEVETGFVYERMS
jgi:dTDP-4-dehydrorhamnose 3,5-epimerase